MRDKIIEKSVEMAQDFLARKRALRRNCDNGIISAEEREIKEVSMTTEYNIRIGTLWLLNAVVEDKQP